jgi:hypothetical protein
MTTYLAVLMIFKARNIYKVGVNEFKNTVGLCIFEQKK